MKTIDRVLIGMSGITVVIGILHPYFIKTVIFTDKDFNELGPIGDWFGGLSGPLIGLSSFILVYLAFRLQSDQINQQQIEYENNNKILSLQRFESSFFKLLSFHNEIVQALWVEYEYVTKKEQVKIPKEGGNEGEMVDMIKESTTKEVSDKREYFSTVYLMMKHNLEQINMTATGLSQEMKSSLSYKESVAIENYRTIYDKEQASLGHYFRHLYHIVKYIHLTDLIKEEEKRNYIAILRSQLSAYELILLFYNCLIQDLGYPKFKYLVDRYDLLQNMNGKLLFDVSDIDVFKSKCLLEKCLNDE